MWQRLNLAYNLSNYTVAVSLTVRQLLRPNGCAVAIFDRKIVSPLLFIVESRVIAHLKGLYEYNMNCLLYTSDAADE